MTGRLKACASFPPSGCRGWIALNKICCDENWAFFPAATRNVSNKFGPIKSSCVSDRAHRLLHPLRRPGGGELVIFSVRHPRRRSRLRQKPPRRRQLPRRPDGRRSRRREKRPRLSKSPLRLRSRRPRRRQLPLPFPEGDIASLNSPVAFPKRKGVFAKRQGAFTKSAGGVGKSPRAFA